MRNIIYLLTLCLGTNVLAHGDGHGPIHQRTGLKSEAVILNDLRQQGIAPSSVILKGQQAEIRATINGKALLLRMDRETGAIQQLSGPNLRIPNMPLVKVPAIVIPDDQELLQEMLKPQVIKP